MRAFIKRFPWHYLFLFFSLVLIGVRCFLVFSYSIDLDGAEFAFVHNIQLIQQDISLYRNPDDFPFYAVMYMPLYYYVLYFFTSLLSVDALQDVHMVYVIARSINIILFLLTLFILYKVMTLYKLSKNVKWLFLMFFVMLVSGHFFAVRPDGFKITLFAIEVYFILRYFFLNEQKPLFFWIMVGCQVTAFLFKQDVIIYNSILLFSLLIVLRTKEIFKLAVVTMAACMLSYLFCVLIFGTYFFSNTFIYNLQSIVDINKSYNLSVITVSLVRLLPLYGCILWLYKRVCKQIGDKKQEWSFIVCTLLLFFISHMAMLKSGSFINYSYELIIILMVLTSKIVSEYFKVFKIHRALVVFFLLYFYVLIKTNDTLSNYVVDKKAESEYKTIYDNHFKAANKLDTLLNDAVFFLPNGSNLIYFARYKKMFYGYEAHIDRFINLRFGLDVKSRLLFASPKKVDDSFRNGLVEYILIEDNQKSGEHMQQYYPDYSLAARVDMFRVYRYVDK